MVLASKLLEAGANPNHMEEVSIFLLPDLTLLQHAQSCVGLLCVCWSADCHVTVIQGGLSALMLSCESGNCEMAELLLKSLADPDLQQSVSHTHRQALHMCICTLCTILLHRTQATLL